MKTKINLRKLTTKALSKNSLVQRQLADYFWTKNQYKNGLKWFLKLSDNEKASFQERAWAFQCLGWMYHNGKGVERDTKRARLAWRVSNAFLRNLALRGNPIAQRRLAENYEAGRGEKRNSKSSFQWSLKAAKLGDMESQYDVGLAYDRGFGVKKNARLASAWYLKAAKKGYPAAQCNLGYAYGNGEGIKKSIKKAIYWTKKAAAKNDNQAQYNLGLAYEEGNGVKQNHAKAKFWIQKAAKNKHHKAQKWLKRNA